MATVVNSNGQQIKMMSALCHQCNDIFNIPSRRGRPPKFCSRCLTGADTELYDYEEARRNAAVDAAKIRVDNLEMMLRSRGTHIKQNPTHWR